MISLPPGPGGETWNVSLDPETRGSPPPLSSLRNGASTSPESAR